MEKVLAYLNLTELGQKKKSNEKLDGKVPMLVKKSDGTEKYVVGTWSDDDNRYVVVYDPHPSMVLEVLNVFSDKEEPKKGRGSKSE